MVKSLKHKKRKRLLCLYIKYPKPIFPIKNKLIQPNAFKSPTIANLDDFNRQSILFNTYDKIRLKS
jgi:hypothetical protein